ncbi:hypothetical protein [Gallaecimonas sp. GXIMD4217]|uniref:hypothetical protein n=1 Tax=Gallaecimonas sp. GXIMD4217 TaxID=3131927 RepID=UPI00311B3E6F
MALPYPTAARQRGASLLVVVALMVMMLALGSALLRILGTGGQSLAQEVLGQEARQMAASSLDAALAQLFPLNASAAGCGAVATSAPDYQGRGLERCDAVIACRRLDGAGGPGLFELTASASCNAGEVTASRALTVTARELD